LPLLKFQPSYLLWRIRDQIFVFKAAVMTEMLPCFPQLLNPNFGVAY